MRGVILHGDKEEEEGEGFDGFRPGVTINDDGGKPAEAQPADGRVEHPTGAGADEKPEVVQGVSTNSD